MSGFHQTVRDVRASAALGFIGEFARSHDFRSITGVNKDPQAKQVTTIAVPASPDNNEEYTVIVDGVEASFTTGESATQAALGAGLEAAINESPGIAPQASYAAGTLTLTGAWPGIAFTAEVDGGDGAAELGAPAEATAAATASPIDFGRVLVHRGAIEGEAAPACAAPIAAHFTAQAMTFTIASMGSGDEIVTEIKANGDSVKLATTYATSQTATLEAHATALNAAIDARLGDGFSVVASSTATTLVLTADVAGAEFEADTALIGAGTSVKTGTSPSPATSLRKALLGISARRLDVESETLGGPGRYHPNGSVEIVTRGRGVLQRDPAQTWSRGSDVYVSVAADATRGRIYTTGGANRVWLGSSPVHIERGEHASTSDGLGVVHLDMGA